MRHPIRPDSYISMDNFYTATVYEKGSEVVRMYHTLLGEEGFRRGMDLYITRHDGCAVTCEDFTAAMSDANNSFDFSQFTRWYSTSGTPELIVDNTQYDSTAQTYEITLTQRIPPPPLSATADTTNNNNESPPPPPPPLHIPVVMGLLNRSNGNELIPSTTLGLPPPPPRRIPNLTRPNLHPALYTSRQPVKSLTRAPIIF